jgi:hypothetical protein
MLRRILTAAFAVLVVACLIVMAQQPMTVAKLTTFIKSAKDLKQTDSQVADFLKGCRMTERLDDTAIEELQSLGAGPKTVAALKLLRDKSAALTAAKPVEPEAQPVKPPPPSSEEQGRILDEVRDFALNYTGNLPDFICTEFTVRSEAPQHGIGEPHFHQVDTLTHHLTYFKQREDYKLIMHNDTPVTDDKQKVGGSSSYGDFGTMMKLLFEPSTQARFEWDDWGTVRGQLVYKFSYHITRDRSNYHLTTGEKGEKDIITAYHGVVKVQKATLKVLQIMMVAEDIPAGFPIQQASTTLDYDYRDISGHAFLLPVKAQVDMSVDGALTRNLKTFVNYGKYTADSSISFGDVPDEKTPPPDPTKKKQ